MGRSVNIKCYTKQAGFVDISQGDLPDFYLVLAGPRSASSSSVGSVRPWVISSAHVFGASDLVVDLRARGLFIGIGSSVRRELWDECEVYPHARSRLLELSPGQREMLGLFG